jgi:hypothetical protein
LVWLEANNDDTASSSFINLKAHVGGTVASTPSFIHFGDRVTPIVRVTGWYNGIGQHFGTVFIGGTMQFDGAESPDRSSAAVGYPLDVEGSIGISGAAPTFYVGATTRYLRLNGTQFELYNTSGIIRIDASSNLDLDAGGTLGMSCYGGSLNSQGGNTFQFLGTGDFFWFNGSVNWARLDTSKRMFGVWSGTTTPGTVVDYAITGYQDSGYGAIAALQSATGAGSCPRHYQFVLW